MAMNWPAFVVSFIKEKTLLIRLAEFYSIILFQEYTEEFRDIAKGSKSKEALPAAPITLINQRPVNEDLHVSVLEHSTKKTGISTNMHVLRLF